MRLARYISTPWIQGALLVGALAGTMLLAAEPAPSDDAKKADAADDEKIVPVHKSESQWRRQLTPRQFAVTRLGDTETAYTGKYWNSKRKGTYICVCCGLELFSSETKFESQTGWPSFWEPVKNKHVALLDDRSELEPRTEVRCARCEAHLGHVFSDGPQPTGLRFCINSAALNFQAPATAKPKPASPAEPKSSAAR